MSINLKTLWSDSSTQVVSAAKLTDNVHADLTVIGGGFSGCSAALHASEQGADVRLVEAQSLAYGASGRNVGLVNSGLWLPPAKVEAILGQEQGSRLNNALFAAPNLVFSLIEKHGIDCESRRAGTLHCAHSEKSLRVLNERYRQYKRLGASVSLLSRQETRQRTGTTAFYGSLHDADAGTIQPLAYCQGLAKAAQRNGAVLHTSTPALSISRSGNDAWLVTTAEGSVRSSAIIIATNAYGLNISKFNANKSTRVNYFQIATKPLDPNLLEEILPGGEGCWDTALVMSSFRVDAAGRLIVGSIGSLHHFASTIHQAWARRKLARLFPTVADEQIDYAWSGRIAMTNDHLPRIIDHGNKAYSVFGYSGRGIGPGTVFGKALADRITGNQACELPLLPIKKYSEPLKKTKQFLYESGATLYHSLACR